MGKKVKLTFSMCVWNSYLACDCVMLFVKVWVCDIVCDAVCNGICDGVCDCVSLE